MYIECIQIADFYSVQENKWLVDMMPPFFAPIVKINGIILNLIIISICMTNITSLRVTALLEP